MITKTIENITIYEQELNLDASIEVYQACQEWIQKKQCYTNVFYTLSHYIGSFKERGWRVGYGYLTDRDNIYIRHCYIVDNEGDIIDPTYVQFEHKRSDKQPLYWTFAQLQVDDYLDLVAQYDNVPDLLKHYEKTHRTLAMWGMKQTPMSVFLDY